MVKAATILIVSYAPWIAILVYTSTKVTYTFWNKIGWFNPPGVDLVVTLLRSFNGGFNAAWITVTGSIVFALLIFSSLKSKVENERSAQIDYPLLLLAMLFAVPILLSLV